MKTLRLAAGLLLAAALARPAVAQTLDPTFAVPTGLYAPGEVYALGPQQADGKRVVAGLFERVNGTFADNLVRLDASGALDGAFGQNVGQTEGVSRVVGLPTGQYLLGGNGNDLRAGNLTRTRLLRLNADGTADSLFDVGTGPKLAVNGTLTPGYVADYAAQPNGKVLVGGSFSVFGGVAAAGVVRLETNGQVDASFGVGGGIDTSTPATQFDGPRAVVVQPDGRVVVGGQFGRFDGQPANGLTRRNANGSRDNSFGSPLLAGSFVESVALQPDGKLLVSGQLVLGGAVNATVPLARLLPSGAPDPAFFLYTFDYATSFVYGGAFNGSPAIVVQPNGKILVTGELEFSATNAGSVYYLARLNADGTLDVAFRPGTGPDNTPSAMGLQANGAVLVGGSFNSFGGTETPLGRLTPAGTPDPAFAPTLQVTGRVATVVRQADGKLLLGGDFTEIGGLPARRLVRLSANGTRDATYAGGLLPGPVTCLALQPDGRAVVGTSAGVRRFDTAGRPDPGFRTDLTATALAMQPNGQVLVGGYGAGTTANNSLVRLTVAGRRDSTFAVAPAGALGPPGEVRALLVQPDGRVVASAAYGSGGGQFNNWHVVRYEATGALDPAFAYATAYTGGPNTLVSPRALVRQPDGKLLVGGGFTAVGGTARPGLARLNPDGTLDAGFAPSRNQTGTVFALALQPNGRVLLGGSFGSPAPAPAYNRLARVLANGQFDPSFAPTANPSGGSVRALLVQPDGAIVLAGLFTAVGGQRTESLARITAPNVLAVSAPAAVAARTTAWPVPAHGRLHVLPDFGARPLTVELLDALGRPLLAQPAAPATETILDLGGRAPGAYLLRVRYAAGAVLRRVVVE